MNKSSCQASQGTNTSHGSTGMIKYSKHSDAATFTGQGARRNCSRYGLLSSLNLW